MREGRSRAFRTQKGEARTPACFGLGRAIPRLPRGRKGGSELRAPAELIAPTEAPVARGIPRSAPFGVPRAMREKAEAESFAPKKGESRTPPACFGLTEPLRGVQGARRGLELRAPGRAHRADGGSRGSRDRDPGRPPSESQMRRTELPPKSDARRQIAAFPQGEAAGERWRQGRGRGPGRARASSRSSRRDPLV